MTLIQHNSFPKSTETLCRHCHAKSETGTCGGCGKCGEIKHTADGRKPPKLETEGD